MTVLVATNVAARGIHIDNLDLVVNIDENEKPTVEALMSNRISSTSASSGASSAAAALGRSRAVRSTRSGPPLCSLSSASRHS